MFLKNPKKLLLPFLIFIVSLFPIGIFASITDGTILSTDQYAWGENVGWINFGTPQGNVHITDTGLTGYAWDSINGWINLAPTNAGVKNDANGTLSGFAWSQGGGFIDFSGVTINSSGKFTGQAYGAVYGRINFDCSHCSVATDWRPANVRPSNNQGVGSPILITDTRSTTTQAQTEAAITPNTPVPTGKGNNGAPKNPPTNESENPVNSQPVINQSGLPTITNQTPPGKTFVTPPQQQFNIDLVLQNIINFFKGLLPVIQKLFSDIKKFINTPIGSAITKSLSILGIVSSLSVPFVSVSFSDLWLIWLRFLGLLLGAIGLKKKSRSWGTVYDSITKRPLDPVYVSLVDVATNKEVAGAITDIDGRYGFLVMPGKYKIVAQKTNYIQPSVKMKGQLFDEVYNDLYFGEEILVTEEGQIIAKNIPMDSFSFDWNEFAKTKMNVNKFIRQKDITWAKISGIIFFIGAIVAFVAVFAAPEPYNYIIAGFYTLAYVLNYVVFGTKKSGTLTEKNTNSPLSFAIVSIFREGEDTPLTKKIADKFGSYYSLVPKGRYYIKVEKKNDDGTYKEIFQSSVVVIKGGVINEDLAL
jgi:hypothetical protein